MSDVPGADVSGPLAFSIEPAELARELEKLSRDYHAFYWSRFALDAAKMIQYLLSDGWKGMAALPSAEVVALHMQMSEGAVRMVYRGIQAVSKAGGQLPALAELEARTKAAVAADAPLRRRAPASAPVTTASAPAPTQSPIRRRSPTTPPVTSGFFD